MKIFCASGMRISRISLSSMNENFLFFPCLPETFLNEICWCKKSDGINNVSEEIKDKE
jgi:hypothetical protein